MGLQFCEPVTLHLVHPNTTQTQQLYDSVHCPSCYFLMRCSFEGEPNEAILHRRTRGQMIFVQQRTAHLKSDFHSGATPPPSPSLPSFSSTENLLNIHRPWGPCYLPVEGIRRSGRGQAQTNKKAGPACFEGNIHVGKALNRGKVLNP